MITQQEERLTQQQGCGDAVAFGISQSDVAHVMSILRGQIYSDRVMAVLREYTSNAWDAHREAGLADKPIRVVLPTLEHPTLEVRDFGRGISPEDVAAVFTQYGASTKRGDNRAVGCLGIGSKAGFAYSDSFVVVSRHAGKCRTYVAVLDSSERGELRLVDEHDCDDSGVSVQIAVRQQDIAEFQTKAAHLLHYMQPPPEINVTLTTAPQTSQHGAIDATAKQWTALMGCVPYRVDLSHLRVAGFVKKIGGVLKFEIGDLHIAASREDLKYTDKTKVALETKIAQLCDEHVETALREVKAASSPWQRRCMAQRLRCFELQSHRDLTATSVDFKLPIGVDAIRSLRRGERSDKPRFANVSGFDVDESARLVVRDDKRALVGFAWSKHDYIVRASKMTQVSAEALELALLAMLAEANCSGLSIVRTSTLPWTAPVRKPRAPRVAVVRTTTPRGRVFELKQDIAYAQSSTNWQSVTTPPAPTDPYVVLDSFKCKEYEDIVKDRRKLRAFDITPPRVIGYRASTKEVVGVPYAEWRASIDALCLASTKAAELRAALDWQSVEQRGNRISPHTVASALGQDHEITTFVRKLSQAADLVDSVDDRYLALVRTMPATVQRTIAEALASKLTRRYPLLFEVGLRALTDGYPKFAIDYVLRRTPKKAGQS